MKKIDVAKHLTDEEYRLLLKVYAEHTSSMGLEQRKAYTFSHIIKVARNPEENCLEVYYENGDWWHYCANGTWY